MNSRRDFIRTGIALGATLTAAGGLGSRLFAEEDNSAKPAQPGDAPRPVLVAVRDGERTAMLDRAMAELGGMEKFVKKGQSVVVKPNIGWDAPPERGANTHPELVKRLVEMCFAAGAAKVSVFDNTCDDWRRTYENSGIEAAAREAGATIVNGKDEAMYREVPVPGGVKLQTVKVHELVLDCDVFINVPVLKHHSGSLMTAGMKNLMGVIWHRGFYHRNDLHQCIADFLLVRKPDLNVVDAYHPMMRNGPRGRTVDDVVVMKTLLASTDIVAIDAAATRLLDHQPSDVRHVTIAGEMGLGVSDLGRVDVRRVRMA